MIAPDADAKMPPLSTRTVLPPLIASSALAVVSEIELYIVVALAGATFVLLVSQILVEATKVFASDVSVP
ncbi:hypothetical protein D3C83_213540 [compost metagenome]